jgi:hypothetical protein
MNFKWKGGALGLAQLSIRKRSASIPALGLKGSLGTDGIKPTYMITRAILKKILP